VSCSLADTDYRLHYGGGWRQPASRLRIDVHAPATGAVIATVPDADADDVAAATGAAQAAFPGWAALDSAARARHLARLADLLRERMGELATLESAVTGRPIREMRAQMSRIPEWLDYFAGICLGLEGEANRVKGDMLTYTAYEPFGVCALLTPWNHPLLILTKKLSAALAAGNVVVVKPSELAPVSPLVFAELARQAGLPPGVVNVVTGGPGTGAALVSDPAVRRIDITGGTSTGRRIAAAAAERLVPCTLELGGKTPVLVFDDAPLDEAVAGCLFAAFVASGQTCVSGSRVLVARSIYERFLEKLAARVGALKVGDPAEAETDIGPVISAASRARCREHIASARAAGARLVAGGDEIGGDGFFVLPTVFADVTPDMRLFNEEVFGPVLAVTPFEDEADALRIANRSDYELGAGIWTKDVTRAHRVAAGLKAGVVWINDHHKNDPRSIWGGYGGSGYGKENGWDALKSYLKKRSVIVRTRPGFDDWFAGGSRYG
jgi:acyl-CoA reductase-like NAD-dependent aldehyde dehydrogenase